MEDAGWTLSPFMCFGCSDAPGRGRRPDYGGLKPPAAAAACGPAYAGHGQGPSGPAGPSPTPRVGCTAIGRQGGPSSVRCRASAGVVCSSLPVRPGARRPPAPGFIKRTGYREGLGAGPIRPLIRSKERLLRKELHMELDEQGVFPSPEGQGRGTGPDGMRRWRRLLEPQAAGRPLGWAWTLSPRVGRVGFPGFLVPP